MYVPVPPGRGGRCGKRPLVFLVAVALVSIGVLACLMLYGHG